MKIKWVSRSAFVPDVGALVQGDEREVDDDYGRRLINSGLAEEVKAKKVKAKTEEESDK